MIDRKTPIAIAIQLIAMFSVVAPSMILARTGEVVYLETEKMDPRALFRGDYVILGYRQAQGIVPEAMANEAYNRGLPLYVTFTTDRPAQFVAVGLEPPNLQRDQFCMVGRVRRWGWESGAIDSRRAVDFPQIAQYFVPEGEGRELEQQRGENLLARVAVSRGCDAVLLGLEPR